MKILLLGDASNYHKCLSVGLARAGHQVTVASHGSYWMGTERDIDISRRKGRLGGAILWAKLNTLLRQRLKGYDVVQISNPNFLELRPHRLRTLFDRLKRDNGGVYLTALGTDPQYVGMCFDSACPLRYTEYRVGTALTPYARSHSQRTAEWLHPEISDYSKYVYDNIDGAVSALYEYHLSCLRHLPADMVEYAGIPVDTKSIAYNPITEAPPMVRVMLACHQGREEEKGVDVMLPLLRSLAYDYPDMMKLDFVQNVPFVTFSDLLSKAHIVVDQLYSYTPATTALMAMASGKIAISGGEKEYYDFIGEKSLAPIINADPWDLSSLEADLRTLIENPHRLVSASADSRAFVLKHNDVDVVARRFTDFWERRAR